MHTTVINACRCVQASIDPPTSSIHSSIHPTGPCMLPFGSLKGATCESKTLADCVPNLSWLNDAKIKCRFHYAWHTASCICLYPWCCFQAHILSLAQSSDGFGYTRFACGSFRQHVCREVRSTYVLTFLIWYWVTSSSLKVGIKPLVNSRKSMAHYLTPSKAAYMSAFKVSTRYCIPLRKEATGLLPIIRTAGLDASGYKFKRKDSFAFKHANADSRCPEGLTINASPCQ